jgi:glycosyltransferase involved in cell wall biosynthesis
MSMLSLVIPCYREAPHLERHVEQVMQTLDLLKTEYEIIFVDDCSPDNTREVIDKIISSNTGKSIRKIFHEQNLGRGGAFMSGFEAGRGEYVGYFDIDLEVLPLYTVEALRRLTQENADLVVGHRHYKVSFPVFYRHLLSRGYRWLVRTFLQIPASLDTESGYKFFRRSALEKFRGRFHYQGWFWESTVRPIRDSIVYLKCLREFRHILRKEALLDSPVRPTTAAKTLEP